MIHTVKGLGIVDETEIDVFLEFLSVLYDPANVGNLLSAVRVVSSTYLRLLMFLLLILILACNSSRPECLMMCSAYRLNKQGDNRQPCLTPFSIFNQSVVPYRVLAVAF